MKTNLKNFPSMDDPQFWTAPDEKAPIIDGQKPDRMFHAVKYVASCLEWRNNLEKELQDKLKEHKPLTWNPRLVELLKELLGEDL